MRNRCGDSDELKDPDSEPPNTTAATFLKSILSTDINPCKKGLKKFKQNQPTTQKKQLIILLRSATMQQDRNKGSSALT